MIGPPFSVFSLVYGTVIRSLSLCLLLSQILFSLFSFTPCRVPRACILFPILNITSVSLTLFVMTPLLAASRRNVFCAYHHLSFSPTIPFSSSSVLPSAIPALSPLFLNLSIPICPCNSPLFVSLFYLRPPVVVFSVICCRCVACFHWCRIIFMDDICIRPYDLVSGEECLVAMYGSVDASLVDDSCGWFHLFCRSWPSLYRCLSLLFLELRIVS